MAGRPSRAQMQGATVTYRVDWVLGTDLLHGQCQCGAQRESEDPIELWQWLTGHPVGHGQADTSKQPDPRHLVAVGG